MGKRQLQTLQEQSQALDLKLDMASRQTRLAVLHRVNSTLSESAGSVAVREWNEIVPRDDYPWFDHPQFSGHVAGRRMGSLFRRPLTSIQDRADGRFHPLFDTEQDLRRMRAQARNVAYFTNTMTGALERLGDYTIGAGFNFEIQPRQEKNTPAEVLAIAEILQDFTDNLLEETNFVGGIDWEIHDRSRTDGEFFLGIYPRDGHWPKLNFIEPEQVVEPAKPLPIERWLGTIDFSQSFWHFGVHTLYCPHLRTNDLSHPIGYHIVFDESGNDWDYIPHSRMIHGKRNTPLKVKRGVSDFVAIQGDVEREAKLKRNTAEGAAVQAAIAFIREHAAGISNSSIEDFVGGQTGFNVQKPNDSSHRTRRVEVYDSPQIKDIPKGMTYHAGPLGTLRSPVFIEVAQFLLRSIGVRWSMPEYMISGDASNANFASTLVAESPFVKARERDQRYYASLKEEFVWKAIGLELRPGGKLYRLLTQAGVTLAMLRRMVRVIATGPAVASRDMEQVARTNETLHRNGILSRRTWAAEAGYDYDEEQANLSEEPAPVDPATIAATGQVLPAMGSAIRAAMESATTPEERRAVLRDLVTEYTEDQ